MAALVKGAGTRAVLVPLRPLAIACPATAHRTQTRPHSTAPHSTETTATGRREWTLEQVKEVYHSPLMNLVFRAATVHRTHFNPREVQQCTLLSIKTGGCTENCGYCSQSSANKTFVKPTPMLKVEDVLDAAKKAKEAGSTRFCMGSAWRDVGSKPSFKHVLSMVQQVNAMGLEVCTTLGMLTAQQAQQLKAAGVTAYNHNLDTSREFYEQVVTTRSYDQRLETLGHVREAGINVCCGGIIGLGETHEDRVKLLHTLASLPTHPESVPVNALVAVEGTRMEDQPAVPLEHMVRMIATARVLMPQAMVRLSAGRGRFSLGEQALMFMAGANSIFTGERLLTTDNAAPDSDRQMLEALGLVPMPPFSPNNPSQRDTLREDMPLVEAVQA